MSNEDKQVIDKSLLKIVSTICVLCFFPIIYFMLGTPEEESLSWFLYFFGLGICYLLVKYICFLFLPQRISINGEFLKINNQIIPTAQIQKIQLFDVTSGAFIYFIHITFKPNINLQSFFFRLKFWQDYQLITIYPFCYRGSMPTIHSILIDHMPKKRRMN